MTIYPRRAKWAYLVDVGPDPLTGARRREYRGGFETEGAALTAAMHVKRTFEEGRHVPASRRTVSAFFVEWLETVQHELKASTYANYRDYLGAYIHPSIGNRHLQQIDVPTLNALYRRLLSEGRRKVDTNSRMYQFWLDERAGGRDPKPVEVAHACGTSLASARAALTRYRRGRVPEARGAGLAPKTVRNVHRMLHRAFRDAVAWRYMAYNPAVHASLPRIRREETARPTPWTAEELLEWLKIAREDRDAGVWLLAATTGMRRSELAGARRDLLDLDAGLLVIEPTRIVVAGRAAESDGKTDAGRRTISLDRVTVAALRAHLDRMDEERDAWGADYDSRGFLLCHSDGRPLHPDTITSRFNNLVDRAGVPRIRLHDVRHTYATLALDAGMDPKILSDRVGHANMTITLQIYGHRSTGRDRQAAESFATSILGADEAPEPRERS